MSSFVFRGVNKITLDKARAEQLLKCNTYRAQRAIKNRRLTRLAAKMEDGRFRIANVALAHCRWDGQTVLVDGQTTNSAVLYLNARAESEGRTADFSVPASLEEYDVETPAGLALLFGQFNDPDSNRTQSEINRTARERLGVEWTDRGLGLVIDALCWLRQGSKRKMGLDDKSFTLTEAHVQPGQFVNDLIFGKDGKPPKHVMRVPVVAAMIRSFLIDRTAANTFWTRVRDGSNLNENSGEKRLYDYLLLSLGGKKKQTSEERRACFVKCIHGWNSFRTGKSTKLSYYKTSETPDMV